MNFYKFVIITEWCLVSLYLIALVLRFTIPKGDRELHIVLKEWRDLCLWMIIGIQLGMIGGMTREQQKAVEAGVAEYRVNLETAQKEFTYRTK